MENQKNKCWDIKKLTKNSTTFSGCMLWIRRAKRFLGYASTIANRMSRHRYRSCFCKWMCWWTHMVFGGQINLGSCHGNDIGNASRNYQCLNYFRKLIFLYFLGHKCRFVNHSHAGAKERRGNNVSSLGWSTQR